MTQDVGPWGPRNPPPTPRLRLPGSRASAARVAYLLCVAAALGGIVAALAHAFPEAVRTQEDWAEVALRAGFVVLIGTALFRFGRLQRKHLRYAALWALVVAALALGFAYRDELSGVAEHLKVAFGSGDPVRNARHELVVRQEADGGFALVGQVNGQRVRFVVDTGSSETVLSPDDARRLGFDVDHLKYVRAAETANGMGYGAPVTARLAVGSVAFADFPIVVNQAPMTSSLLGLSFLNRLESFQVKDHRLVMRPRSAG